MIKRQRPRQQYLKKGWVVLVCLTLFGCATAPASSPTTTPNSSIAVLDAQRVLNETEAGKAAKESLSAFVKNRQDLIQLEEKELKRMEESLVKQRSVLSANARKQREGKFRQRMMQYQQKAAVMNREVQEKQREVLDGFRAKIEKVVQRIAADLQVKVVIEKGPGTPTVYSDGSVDVTDRIIQEFNRSAK